ncbi:hypothetical protein [Agromyces sp. ZXT2-6]|uniref:hypothetical protein n=1 Tax=Agromyces sp. ZXT2-6 TaxID=3461153 RepID=UPI004054A3E8
MTERLVVLQADEALVLFDLLSRWEDEDRDLRLEQGEQTAIDALLGALERLLVEPFKPEYSELVREARQRLFDRGGA